MHIHQSHHDHNNDYAPINHNHDQKYAPITHDHDLDYSAINHGHTVADVTGLQTALDGKADDIDLDGKADVNHSHSYESLTDIPTSFKPEAHNHTISNVVALQTKLNAKADLDHGHAIVDITGLQTALDGKPSQGDLDLKANKGDSYTKAETYRKSELYNRTEIDQMTMGEGGGSPIIVEDNLESTNPNNALSSNQGRILNETKAPIDHDHEMTDITGLQPALDGKADMQSQSRS